MRKNRYRATVALALGLCAGGHADTIVWYQSVTNAVVTNYTGTADTSIDSYNPTFNYGGGKGGDKYNDISYTASAGSTGRQNALIRFDLSTFAGSYEAVTGITLRLQFNAMAGTGTVSVYRVRAANAGWVAGTANGAFQLGSCSWDHRAETNQVWAGSPGAMTPGVDVDPMPLAQTFVGTLGNWNFACAGADTDLTALVSTWLTPTNAGLLLNISTPADLRFRTSNRFFIDAGVYPPVLTIDYIPIPEPLLAAGVTGLTAALACRYRWGHRQACTPQAS